MFDSHQIHPNVYFHSHIIRVVYELSYETFEVTGPQMVLTMKLTTFAWNVWDSRRPVEVWNNVMLTNPTEPIFLAGSGQMAARKTGHKIPLAARVLGLFVGFPISRLNIIPDEICEVLFPGVPRRAVYRLCVLQVLD